MFPVALPGGHFSKYRFCRERRAEAHKLLEMVAKQTPPLNALIDAWRPFIVHGFLVLVMHRSITYFAVG